MKAGSAGNGKIRGKPQYTLLMVVAALALIAVVWSLLVFVVPNRSQTLDQHVKNVASQLRCPVCQGESVADSSAPLAQQMRQVIRAQLQAGRSDQEIVQYFASRYGEQNIVWSPPWQGFTLLTWVVPILLLCSGVLLLFFLFRDWLTISRLANRYTYAKESISPTDIGDMPADDSTLERYRAQLEQELAADDALFRHYKTEAN